MKKPSSTNGIVSLVGAGPGDPELLTLKALKAIESAQAVVYDRLVSDAIMQHVPKGIPTFYAGKSCKQKAMTQEEINELLISLARTGTRVVRLKGGDPFLFGRGGEECIALKEADIPYEIVPGISSAQGCGAYAGIPLTHRGLATGVRFLTGHRMTKEEGQEELEMNWQSLADPDTTLVVYMGLVNLPIIASKLIEHGLPPTTPAAAIEQGTLAQQKVTTADLADIANKVESEGLQPPTLVIIGKVAALSDILQWVDQSSLKNTSESPSAFTKLS
ncbi:MAG: uroporphyrinogen-III C-methyltransferase [Rickettsiales bacterium]